MVCDRRCDQRLLIEGRLSLSQLISLNELRERIPKDQLASRAERLLATAPEQLMPLLRVIQDPFVICVVLLAVSGSLPLYVADPTQDHAYPIRPDVVRIGCCGWPLDESVHNGRFTIQPTLMRHGSPEVRLDGQPIYVRKSDIAAALGLRPTSKSRLTKIIQEVIDEAIADGTRPTTKEVVARVTGHPDVWGRSAGYIHELFNELKPKDWGKAERPRKSRI